MVNDMDYEWQLEDGRYASVWVEVMYRSLRLLSFESMKRKKENKNSNKTCMPPRLAVYCKYTVQCTARISNGESE